MLETLFDQLPLFQGLSAAQKEILRPLFSLCQEEADVVIFEQGAPAENLYILVEGEIHIGYKPDDGPIDGTANGPVIVIARVHSNGVVGWSTALCRPTYTSAAICVTNCTMLRISGRNLRGLCDRYPEIGGLLLDRLAAAVAERRQDARPQVMALLQAGLRAQVESHEKL
jgi:CRP-like cAMP-binding protein